MCGWQERRCDRYEGGPPNDRPHLPLPRRFCEPVSSAPLTGRRPTVAAGDIDILCLIAFLGSVQANRKNEIMNPVVEALALLTPFDVDKKKVRIGPKTDGGYILLDDLSPEQTVISYGISTEYKFEEEMAKRGHNVYMFDHTIPSIDAISEKMKFYPEGVAGVSDPVNSLYSIEDHLAKCNIHGNNLILKMDVEGAELDAIGMASPAVLQRFDQIALEIHGLSNLNDDVFREKVCVMLRRINNLFTLFHVHANNYDGSDVLYIVSGIPVSNILELSYTKTINIHSTTSRTLYPTALDFPNVRGKDKLLWFYPFLPTNLSFDDFAICEERIDLIHKLS